MGKNYIALGPDMFLEENRVVNNDAAKESQDVLLSFAVAAYVNGGSEEELRHMITQLPEPEPSSQHWLN